MGWCLSNISLIAHPPTHPTTPVPPFTHMFIRDKSLSLFFNIHMYCIYISVNMVQNVDKRMDGRWRYSIRRKNNFTVTGVVLGGRALIGLW